MREVIEEFKKVLKEYGNRMDQLSLLEYGDIDLGIESLSISYFDFAIIKYKNTLIEISLYGNENNGMYISEDYYLVKPIQITKTIYERC